MTSLLDTNIPPTFNRTTVECKDRGIACYCVVFCTFNRTTVECKATFRGRQGKVEISFNRTTVECKGKSGFSDRSTA